MNNRSTYSSWLAAVSLISLLCLGYAGGAGAGEVINLKVDQAAGIYTVRLEMELEATADYVHQVLTNYHQLHRMNPSIMESRVLSSSDDEVVRVLTRMKSCVLFICNTFTRVEDVYQSASGHLMAVIVPDQSDFKSGTASWHITDRGDHTLLVYEASMQPGFFIPPMVGNFLVKKKLEEELLVSFNRIECCASSRVRLSRTRSGEGSVNTSRSVSC